MFLFHSRLEIFFLFRQLFQEKMLPKTKVLKLSKLRFYGFQVTADFFNPYEGTHNKIIISQYILRFLKFSLGCIIRYRIVQYLDTSFTNQWRQLITSITVLTIYSDKKKQINVETEKSKQTFMIVHDQHVEAVDLSLRNYV